MIDVRSQGDTSLRTRLTDHNAVQKHEVRRTTQLNLGTRLRDIVKDVRTDEGSEGKST